jgi:hypothetical protein
MLFTDEHLLAGGCAVVDCDFEPVYVGLEHKVVTHLQFMESSTPSCALHGRNVIDIHRYHK